MFEEFKKVLVDQMNLDPAQITEKAELVNDLGINSLELADLVFTCEDCDGRRCCFLSGRKKKIRKKEEKLRP